MWRAKQRKILAETEEVYFFYFFIPPVMNRLFETNLPGVLAE